MCGKKNESMYKRGEKNTHTYTHGGMKVERQSHYEEKSKRVCMDRKMKNENNERANRERCVKKRYREVDGRDMH